MNEKLFASWWRGKVYLLEKNWVKIIKKQARYPIHKGAIYKEAQILKFIAKQNIDFVPRILSSWEDRFEQQFIEGQALQKIYPKVDLTQKRKFLSQLVDIAYKLDQAWVVHWEISRPFKNFLVDSTGKIWVIDFERWHLFDKSWANLRWLMQFLISQWVITVSQAKRLGHMRNLDELYWLLKKYIKQFPFNHFLEFFGILIFLILVDILTKMWFTTQFNYGSSFGISWFSNQALIVLGLIVGSLVIYWTIQKKLPILPSIFLIAGIIGNTMDRLLYEWVRDWLNWWIFTNNLADIWITIWIAGILYCYFLNNGKKNFHRRYSWLCWWA